jgi:redox-sensitive bicupin YhaK (pirin superfamily)
MQIRRGADRGYADHGWLRSFHTFSFADYYDPAQMGFRVLRVINEDRVAGGQGFGAHPHRDMEIVSYVLGGALAHRDSMGTGSIIRPGEIQRMSAGSGVVHSEHNASPTEEVHFLQIWIIPERNGLPPGYEQKRVPRERGKLNVIGSPRGGDAAVTIHQDATILNALLGPGDRVRHELGPTRHAWVHVARGAITVNGKQLAAGDAAAFGGGLGKDAPTEPGPIELAGADGESEVLIFDLA